ncbi:MAG: DASS family sodium-coupled anion symporter [Ectothiorhodospiraceae bacterium]|nr:DASS family sodium-coupled anion symporter [Ectothiorhodospiraceae bacterium]
MLLMDPPGALDRSAWMVAALTILMAVWWVTEALPIPVTALLPLALLPLFGVATPGEAAAPYANPLVFLFLGGFLIALAIQRWNLHRRIALFILRHSGQRPDRLVAGFMLGTAGLSMWVSNTATAAMMLPIGLSVLLVMESHRGDEQPEAQQRFARALLLGIAFAANIGGMGTLIGTPPNAILAAFMAETYGIQIGFGQWMLVGLPVSLVLLFLCWWVLTHWAFRLETVPIPGVADLIERKRGELGPISASERRVLLIFLLTALAWVLRPVLETRLPGLHLSDAGIAVLGAIGLFLVPAAGAATGPLLNWRDTRELPWGVILLVGGGLSLGTAIEASGLSTAVAGQLVALEGLPVALVVFAVATLTLFLSHVASNTATAATLLPLVTSIALTIGQPPLTLAVPVALAASCAFMLPVATPPNAIVFGSERLHVGDMVRAGSRITLLTLPVVVIASLVLAPWALGR